MYSIYGSRDGFVTVFVTVMFYIVYYSVTVSKADETSTTGCYCLKELKTELRNPIHMEETTLDGQKIFLIGEQRGMIHIFNPKDGTSKPYIDMRDEIVSAPDPFDERGLLGFALHPNFKTNKRLFIYSIRGVGGSDYVVISEIRDRNLAEEKLLMMIEQPGTRRNGGQLLFGDDGYLYIFVGDGGPAQQDRNDAQNTSTLLGKVLRVNVDETTVEDFKIQYYTIPDDNPLKAGWRPEIYALGVRNMWRCSLDKGDPVTGEGKGRIFCGDLGSDIADELNQLIKGSNYGWHYREGLTCFSQVLCNTIEDEMFPMYVFNRSTSSVAAVVCGPLYRGSKFKSMRGHLLYGDYVSGSISSIEEKHASDWVESEFKACPLEQCGCDSRAGPASNLLSFGEDDEGEVYLLMTDVPSVVEPHGVLLQMLPSRSGQPVTCGQENLRTSIYLLWICIIICLCSKR